MTQPTEEKGKGWETLESTLNPDVTEFIRLVEQYFHKSDPKRVEALRERANEICKSIMRRNQRETPKNIPDADSIKAEILERLRKEGVQSWDDLSIEKPDVEKRREEARVIAQEIKRMLPQLKIILKKVANDLILGTRSAGDAKIIIRFLLRRYEKNQNFIDELNKKLGDFELKKLLEFKDDTSAMVVRVAFARVLRRAEELLSKPATLPEQP